MPPREWRPRLACGCEQTTAVRRRTEGPRLLCSRLRSVPQPACWRPQRTCGACGILVGFLKEGQFPSGFKAGLSFSRELAAGACVWGGGLGPWRRPPTWASAS